MATLLTRPTVLLATLAVAALLAAPGCDSASSGGGDVAALPPGSTAGGGESQSFFGKFASGRQPSSASRASDSSANEASSGGSSTQAPCVPDPDTGQQCSAPAPGTPGGTIDVDMPEIPVCTQPLPVTPGVAKPCGDFCKKAGDCLDASAGETSLCTSECQAAMTGVQLAAVTEFFGCLQAASCDEVLDFLGEGGGGSNTSSGSSAEPTPQPTEPDTDTPPKVPPTPEGQGKADSLEEEDGLDKCFLSMLMGWSAKTPNAGRLQQCKAVMKKNGECDQGDSTMVSSGSGSASGGQSSGEVPSTEPVPAPQGESSGKADDPSEPGGDDEAMCRAIGQVLTDAGFGRFYGCTSRSDCEEFQKCFLEAAICVPFTFMLPGLASDDEATVSVSDPSPTPSGNPTEPASGEGGGEDAPGGGE